VHPEHPHRLVATFEERLGDLETRFHEAYWRSQIESSPENDRRRAELELELRRIKGDAEALAGVDSALQEELHDPVLKRRLEVLRLSLTGNQMSDDLRTQIVDLSSSVESDFNRHRPRLDGRSVSDNEIEEILRSSNDVDLRRQTWEASKEIGAVVAPRVRELARLRNQVARDLGYADYFRMALELQELDEDWLFRTLEELEQLTQDPFTRWKKELDERLAARFGSADLMPWHYPDPFFQNLPAEGGVSLDELLKDVSAPDMAVATFAAWGIDLAGVMRSSDLYPRDHKSQHAFCLHVDRKSTDVRILANVVPGERWVEVMLHESGHAAYDLELDPHLPYLLRRHAHIFVTESIALLSGRLARDPDWLVQIAGRDLDEVARLQLDLRRADAAQSLIFARWVPVVTYFERELYSDPEGDLNARWWDLVERFQMIQRPPGRDASPDWAAKIHIAAAPVYYQNYLLGDLLASQLIRTCRDECGGVVGNAAAGRLLKERVFKPGSLMRWDALIEQATGRPLSANDFADQVGV
jgi:peptidyl-dipeptidase A